MHLFQVARVFNCKFPIEEVASFLHDPEARSWQAINETTSAKEIATVKYSMQHFHKSRPSFLVCIVIESICFNLGSISRREYLGINMVDCDLATYFYELSNL